MQSLGISFEAQCFQAIKHSDDGDIIQVRDCVILRSGPKKTDIPFVAKVTQFWKHPQDGEKLICSDLIDLSNRKSGGYITTCISRVLFNLSIIQVFTNSHVVEIHVCFSETESSINGNDI